MQRTLDELKRARSHSFKRSASPGKNLSFNKESVRGSRSPAVQYHRVRGSRSPAVHYHRVRGSRSPAPNNRLRDSRSPGPIEVINLTDNELPEQVSECWGDDPDKGKTTYFDLHPQLAKRVNHIASNGLDKETTTQLANKYPCPKGVHIGPPLLNAEVAATMGPVGLAKDKHQVVFQEENAKGISNLLYAVNKMINDDNEEISKKDYVEILSDTTRHYVNLQHKLSLQRRSFINNNLSKLVIDLSATTPVDTFLYGENLAEKIKTAKGAEKTAKEMTSANVPNQRNPKYLNSYGPARKLGGNPRQGPRDYRPLNRYPPQNLPPKTYQRTYQRGKTNQAKTYNPNYNRNHRKSK